MFLLRVYNELLIIKKTEIPRHLRNPPLNSSNCIALDFRDYMYISSILLLHLLKKQDYTYMLTI